MTVTRGIIESMEVANDLITTHPIILEIFGKKSNETSIMVRIITTLSRK